MNNVHIISDKNPKSFKIKTLLQKIIKKNGVKKSKRYFYGVNSGNYGFLMNKFSSKSIIKNLNKAKLISISPLEMHVRNNKNQIKKHIAINEVSILRQSRQAASLSINYGSRMIIKKLVSDRKSVV